ncbi:hypothetical protein B0H13DRAFT_1899668 [Mycena leptocephala]|nr:hypothetical protein B0H13DRAFT_1899668 [Mycena leptocephala]
MSDYSTVHLNDPEDNHSHIQPDSVKSAGNARKAEGSEFGQPRFDAATESQKPPPYPTSAPPHRDHGFDARAFLWMFLGWPAFVISGQIIIQVLAWYFFALVQTRGTIALPYSTASLAKANPHVLTLVSTLISTALGAFSIFLFSSAVRHSIAHNLQEPMLLANFVFAIGISSGSPVLHPRKWRWSAVAIVVAILVAVQTSAWNTFVTPVEIVIHTAVSGTELDLTSPALHQMYSNNPERFEECIINSSIRSAFIVSGTDSGYALSKHKTGIPALFNLMDQTFNVSTAGILPATLRDVNASTWFENMTTIPSTLRGLDHLPRGFSSNYSMTQQVNVTYAFTSESFPNYVLMLPCGTTANYTLIFEWSGDILTLTTLTNLTKTLSVSPKITKVNVDYSDPHSPSGTITSTVRDDPAVWDLDGPTGVAAVSAMVNMVFNGQTSYNNIVGSQIKSLVTDVNDSNTTMTSLTSTEAYIQGVAEYSGSIFRACLSGKNATFVDGVPANMTVPTNGTIFTDTLGWMRHGPTSVWVLVPGALIALATVVIVIRTVAHHAREPIREPFDPAAPMHLMAAVAAGELGDVFTGTRRKDLRAAENTNILLHSSAGHGPALVPARNTSST